MTRLFYDCAGSEQDLAVLSLLLKQPEFELQGVSITPCSRTVPQAAVRFRRILPEKVPLSRGPAKTVMDYPGESSRPAAAAGAGLRSLPYTPALLEQISAPHRPFAYVAAGPLTSLAVFLLAAPHCLSSLDQLLIACGAVYGGNRTPCAEENAAADPEAAQIVLHAGLPTTIFPLEITADRSCDTVGYCPGLVPLLYLLDPAPFVFKRYTVEVELESRVSRGCTVMDVLARDKTLPRHAVAVGADWSRLHARLSAQAGLRPAEKEGCFHA